MGSPKAETGLALFPREFLVDGGVQRWVVVHLQLAIEFKALGPSQRLLP